jgi:LysR family transcriptional regulator, nitrogen assimilation regulatory protein
MDRRQLRYFCAVARHANFGKAADALGVTQPALSRQVQILEVEIGAQLFRRHRRGVTLTADGSLLHERAEFLLRQFDQIEHDLKAKRQEASGPVSLGLSPGIAALLAPAIAIDLAKRWPTIRLRLYEAFAPRLHEMLLDGQLDVALLAGIVPRTGLVLDAFMEEQICLIGPKDHRAVAGDSVGIAALDGLPIILNGLPRAGLRLELETAAARAGIRLAVRAEVDTINVAFAMVRAGLGFTAHIAWNADMNPDLRAIPVRGLRLRRSIARASDRPASRAVVETERALRRAMAGLLQSGQWPHARPFKTR